MGDKEELSAIRGCMEELGANMKVVIEQLTFLRGDVEGLKQDVSVLKQDVSVLKQDVSVLKQDMSEVKQDISMLKQDVNVIKSKQDKDGSILEELSYRYIEHSADIRELKRAK
jgi:phage shock protein A